MIFVDSPRVSRILGYLQSKEAVQEATEEGTAHLGAQAPPGGLYPPRVPPQTASLLYKYPNILKILGESTKY